MQLAYQSYIQKYGKRFLFYLSCCLPFACSDDIGNRIEGQWQLKTIEENGIVSPVDTIFYSFMRERVFSCTLLLNPDESYIWYGYIDALSDQQMQLSLDWNNYYTTTGKVESEGGSQQRIFDILHLGGNYLTLFSNDITYSFKKH
ncbi:MAG: hypothetical protein LBM08_14480 [Dysgonamonadaceae bacterium]|jgi:hypothetical protein|nr:hypothetical protein [Dysgonamonadaceae bacterium]